MSKCSRCHTKKAKRTCKAYPDSVCTTCCGASRVPHLCQGCVFYSGPVRRYQDLPRCSPKEMEVSHSLQQISFPVEAALCTLDRERDFKLTDAQAIAIIELLLDLYAFGDPIESVASRAESLGFRSLLDRVLSVLRPYDQATIVKVLGLVRHTACRREHGGRHHMEMLQQYVGSSLRPDAAQAALEDGQEPLVGGLAYPSSPAPAPPRQDR